MFRKNIADETCATSTVTHHKYQRLYTLSQHLPSPQQYCSRVHSPDLHMDADAVPTSSSSNITSDSRKAAVAVATVTARCCCTGGGGGGGEAVVISTGRETTTGKTATATTTTTRGDAAQRRTPSRVQSSTTALAADGADDGDARYLAAARIPVSCATPARLPNRRNRYGLERIATIIITR